MNILVHISVQKCAFIYLEHILRNRVVRWYRRGILNYLRNCKTDLQNDLHFHKQSMGVPVPLHWCQNLVLVGLFNLSCCNTWVVMSHCGFNLHFPNGKWFWTSVHVHICHIHIFFVELSIQIFGLLLKIGLFVFLSLHFKCAL